MENVLYCLILSRHEQHDSFSCDREKPITKNLKLPGRFCSRLDQKNWALLPGENTLITAEDM